MYNSHEYLRLSAIELSDKVIALIDNYEIARRYVLGLYGWKGVEDNTHVWHCSHPEHIENEILCYAGVLAGENGGFWNTELFKGLTVLDRLEEYEICPPAYREQLVDIYPPMKATRKKLTQNPFPGPIEMSVQRLGRAS